MKGGLKFQRKNLVMEIKVALIASDTQSLYCLRRPLIQRLESEGHTVVFGCPKDQNWEKAISALGNRLFPLSIQNTKINPLLDLRVFWELYQFLKFHKPKAVYLFHIKPVLYTSLVSYFFPLVQVFPTITGLGYLYINQSFKTRCLRKLTDFFYKLAFKRAEKIEFQNKDDRDYFIQRKLIDPSKAVITFGSGVDLQDFPYTKLPSGPPVFLFIGRLLKDKGLQEFLKAASIVRSVHKDVVFEIVGGASSNPAALDPVWVESECEKNKVIWHGQVEDVRPFLQKCTAFVLPSYREGVPRAGLEALATGRPIITTDAPGCRDLIVEPKVCESFQKGKNGYLVPVQDAQALALAILDFLKVPQSWEGMAEESRRLVELKVRGGKGAEEEFSSP